MHSKSESSIAELDNYLILTTAGATDAYNMRNQHRLGLTEIKMHTQKSLSLFLYNCFFHIHLSAE